MSATSDTPDTPDRPSAGSPDASEATDAPRGPQAPEVTAENAAEILAAGESPDDAASAGSRPSRRKLLIGGGIAAAAVVAGGAWLTLRRTNQGVTGAAKELPLVIGGDICAAPLYAAYHHGYFDDAGLKVTLARTQRTEDTKDALSAGKYIGAPGIFFSWLEPIYNGINARLTGGIHSGCPAARGGQRLAHHTAGRLQGQEDRRALPVQLGIRLLRDRPVQGRAQRGSRARRHLVGDH